MRALLSIFLITFGLLCTNVAAQQALSNSSQEARTPQGSPETQRLLTAILGKWRVQEQFEPANAGDQAEVGDGEVVWRPGPGGLSLIEEYHSNTSTGLSVTWWDGTAKGFRAVWCADSLPTGCIVMSKLANWEGNQFVLGDEFERSGKKFVFKETLSDITPTTYTQELYQGEFGGELKKFMTVRATKLSSETVLSTPAAPTLKIPGPNQQELMLGTWNISVRHEPGQEMPNGSTGLGTEIWRAGPGGLSVIEESREKNDKENIEGFGVAWWDNEAQGQRFVWCENGSSTGCYVSKNVARWESGNLVWSEEQEVGGIKRRYSEIFRDISPNSFTQVLQEGEHGKEMKTTATIWATRIGTQTEAELRAVMAERRRASIEGDVEAVASSMTDDYLQTDIYGYRQDKTAWLNEYFKPLAELIKAGKFHWDVYEQKELQFRSYGDCAVVTGNLEAKGTGAKPGPQHTWVADSNASFSGTLHFTHLYIKRHGKWLLAALHNQLPLQPPNPMK